MGGGYWDASTYAATTGAKIAAGTTFGYSSATRMRPHGMWAADPSLDPVKCVAGPSSPFAGRNIRESRDNPDHPTSVPVAVFFDQTGSMGHVPVELQKKLAELFGLLLRKGYVTDPQVLVGAYGDAYCDMVPLQASQFESDNRIDDALDKLFLEGAGGGNDGETATLAWYFAATHTATDAWDKRGKKGYLFTIGDECALPITVSQILEHTTDTVQADLTPKDVVALASQRWEVFHLVVDNYAAHIQDSVRKYTELLGDHCVVLEDPLAAAETIAGIIGMCEGTLDDVDSLVDDLVSVGASTVAVKATAKALSTLSTSTAVVTSATPEDLDLPDDFERL